MNELIYFGSYVICGKLSACDFELLTYVAHTLQIPFFLLQLSKIFAFPLYEFGVGGVLRGHLGSARKECALTFRYGDDAFSLFLGVVLSSLGNLNVSFGFCRVVDKVSCDIHSFIHSWLLLKT
jgi:hypothetical protein